MEYIKKLIGNDMLIVLGTLWATLYNFLFPERIYATAAMAVLGVMMLDLLTKTWSLARRSGGFLKALRERRINSKEFSKGTMDKLVVFGVMLLICGFAYKLTVLQDIAIWFTQAVFTIMFFRDAMSIVENLIDAGVSGLGPFKKLLKHKIDEYEYMKEEEDNGETKE